MRAIPTLILLFCAVVQADIREGSKGTVYLPDDLKPSEVVPVLIVEKGVAQAPGKLWAALVAKGQRVVLVETVNLRGMLRHRDSLSLIGDAMLDALREGNRHHDIARCPWIVVGFSAAARPMGHIALRDAPRYQGLLLINSGLRPQDVPARTNEAKSMRIAILNGDRDPYVSVGQAKLTQDALKSRGIAAELGVVETGDHLAPTGDLGSEFIAGFLAGFPGEPVEGRGVPVAPETIETEALDGLPLTADLYETGDKSQPILLLFHQAKSSRGEYRRIAPRLVENGFNCLALDQRSGDTWAGVANETARRAKEQGKGQDYIDARQDLDRAVAWARELGFSGPLGVIGSSYSSSLVFFVGAENEEVGAVVSFSPGDYLPPRGSIHDAAAKLTVPILIVCPANEEQQARPIYEQVAAKSKSISVQGRGVHGASTLYRSATPEAVWKTLLEFLDLSLVRPMREDAGQKNSGRKDSGQKDSGQRDPGQRDSGQRDSGRKDSR